MMYGPTNAEVAQRAGVAHEDAATVLAVELEYMWRVGIAVGPDPGTRYYQEVDLVGAPSGSVDTGRIAEDCARLAGVDLDVARAVLYAEFELLTEDPSGEQ